MAHLFNYSGAPWLTQKWLREVKDKAFGEVSPYGGYNGDEDQGQMGALGVLMAIGLFQMDGGCAVNSSYELTTPIFDEIEIGLHPDYYPGENFQIITRNNSPENRYIQQSKLNQSNWNSFQIPHEVLVRGGVLEFYLDSIPNKNWGRGDGISN
jgi:putative alpha-1,2-mannosidase